MNQIKIGKFISSCRKEQGMTQAALAEKLGISDRAVSKWETGKSLPDSGIMLELCEILNINVNELLSGERIMVEKYDSQAEKNLLALRKEVEEKDKQLLRLEVWFGIPIIVIGLALVAMASFVNMAPWARICMIAIGGMTMLVFAFVGVGIEQKAGYYECQICKHRYVPTYWKVNLAPHVGRTRHMVCPECGQKSWQKKVISAYVDSSEESDDSGNE